MKSILNVKTFFFILILAFSVSEIYGRGIRGGSGSKRGSSSSRSYGSKSSGSSKSSSISSSGSGGGGSSKTSNSGNSGSVKSSGTSNSGNSASVKSYGTSNSGSSSVSSSGTSNSGSFGSGRSYGTSSSGSFDLVNRGSFGDNSIHYIPKQRYGHRYRPVSFFPPNYNRYGIHRSNSGLGWNLNDYDSKSPERYESTLSDIENLKFDPIYRPTTSSYESWPIKREPGSRNSLDGFKTHSSDFGSYENERVMKDIMAGSKEMRDASMNFGRFPSRN